MADKKNTLPAGYRIENHYTLTKVIGTGGMSIVYEATRDDSELPVAVKVMEPGTHTTPARFFNELMLATRVKHPNVTEILDFGMLPNGQSYLVMERLFGESLRKRMRRGPMTIEEAVPLFLGAIDALALAHSVGVVHKDLKPENLFLANTDSGVSMIVLDFGVASRVGESRSGLIEGTPKYLPPEVIAGNATNAAADVYQLGLVLVESIIGRPLVGATESEEQLKAHLSGVQLPAELVGGPLDVVLTSMLMRDPADRLKDAKAVRSSLSDLDLSAVIRATQVPLMRMRAQNSLASPPVKIHLETTKNRFGFAPSMLMGITIGALVTLGFMIFTGLGK